MKKSFLFFVSTTILAIFSVLTVQAAEYTATVDVKSQDVFGNTGAIVWDKPVVQSTFSADFGNGWRASGMASLGDGASLNSGSNGSRATLDVSRAWKFGKYDVTTGLAYHNLWKLNNVDQDALMPYMQVSMPIGKNAALFARGEYYLVKNSGNGNTLAVGATYNQKVFGMDVNHKVSIIRDNTLYSPQGKGTIGMYDGNLVMKMTKAWDLIASVKVLGGVGGGNRNTDLIGGLGVAYKF